MYIPPAGLLGAEGSAGASAFTRLASPEGETNETAELIDSNINYPDKRAVT